MIPAEAGIQGARRERSAAGNRPERKRHPARLFVTPLLSAGCHGSEPATAGELRESAVGDGATDPRVPSMSKLLSSGVRE